MNALRQIWQRASSVAQALVPARSYARALQAELARLRDEIARLRAENRALLNSILGIAGIPPVQVEAFPTDPPGSTDRRPGGLGISTVSAEKPQSERGPSFGPASPATAGGLHSHPATPSGPEAPASGPASPPHSALLDSRSATSHVRQLPAPRRRSWHQINRILEFEAAQKK